MTWRILAEDTISPSAVYNSSGSGATRTVDLRALLDTGGPHLMTFGVRTVVADPSAAFCQMKVVYETPNGQLRTIDPGPADLSVITDATGAMWYADMVTVIDKYYPLADGPGSNPLGTFFLQFNAGAAGTSKISYECMIYSFDGSSTVINIP
jgi:hypothetical protein